jgi:phage gp29-like protein
MSDAPALVDRFGAPMRKSATAADLKKAVATASLTGVRQAWNYQSIASGLTPERLARIMRLAAEGDHRDYVILAEEMEERDWHYAAALNQRKLAVLGLERIVEAASDSAQDKEIAQAVQAIVEDEAFEDLLAGNLDAIGKGWSAVEIGWDTPTNGMIQPVSYEWKPPEWFRWDRETGQELRLIDEKDVAFGIPLQKNRFSVHEPKLKMGLPVRGGLARLAAWAFLFKFYSVKDWAAFTETYGQPLRVGKYDPAATKEDIEVLYQAVAMIGTDCAAVIPQAMQIEFVNAQQGASQSGAQLYQAFCDWLDRQVSKAVLGQTGTTDMQHGGGLAQAKVLDGVRVDLRDSDAKQLARTVRRDIFTPFVLYNWGPGATIPGLRLQASKAEDLERLAAGLTPFIDRGLKVRASQIREKFELDEPDPDDEVLGPDSSGASVPLKDGQAINRVAHRLALGRHGDGCACAGCKLPLALNRPDASAGGVADADAIDDLADPLNEGWEEVMDPAVEPILQLAQRAGSYAEFSAELDAAASAMDMSPLAKSLALQLFKAKGLGDATDQPRV